MRQLYSSNYTGIPAYLMKQEPVPVFLLDYSMMDSLIANTFLKTSWKSMLTSIVR